MLITKKAENAKIIYGQTIKNSYERVEKADGTADKLVIAGFASTPTEDSYNDIVEPRAFTETMARYEKNPIILLQHKMDKPIGQIAEWSLSTWGLYVKGEILHNVDDCFAQIEKGTLRGFSIGFRLLEWLEDTAQPWKRWITKLELVEISVVSVPANPDTVFSIEKALRKYFDDGDTEAVVSVISEETPQHTTQPTGDETGGETPPSGQEAQGGEKTPESGGATLSEDEVKSLVCDATKELAETLATAQKALSIANEEKTALSNLLCKAEEEKALLQKALDEANHLIDTTEIRSTRKVEAKSTSDDAKLRSYYSKAMSQLTRR